MTISADDTRQVMLAWIDWFVQNQPYIFYSEGGDRMEGIGHPGLLPLHCDCSSTDTCLCNWVGIHDPNKQIPEYNGVGSTLTFWEGALTEVSFNNIQGCDFVIYGMGGPVGSQHMAVFVSGGADPVTMSHGWSGEPAYIDLQHGDPTGGYYGPPRYWRYDMTVVHDQSYPPGFSPKAIPGSVAAKLQTKAPNARPFGRPPVLDYKKITPDQYPWLVYLRRLLNTANVLPLQYAPKGAQYGMLTANRVIRWKEAHGLAHDAEVGAATWESLGVR